MRGYHSRSRDSFQWRGRWPVRMPPPRSGRPWKGTNVLTNALPPSGTAQAASGRATPTASFAAQHCSRYRATAVAQDAPGLTGQERSAAEDRALVAQQAR
ncbi:hypothetical protein ABPG75_007096 [Micractinium tetrahymenae]